MHNENNAAIKSTGGDKEVFLIILNKMLYNYIILFVFVYYLGSSWEVVGSKKHVANDSEENFEHNKKIETVSIKIGYVSPEKKGNYFEDERFKYRRE